MESLKVWSTEEKQRSAFHDGFDRYRGEIERDVTSSNAKALVDQCKALKSTSEKHIKEVEMRLYLALMHLAGQARFIHPDKGILRRAQSSDYIKDPADNLILCCILEDARQDSQPRKAFTSENKKDFGKPEIVKLLQSVGVEYFPRTSAALGWLRAQPNSSDVTNPST
jgi:hypothetical protein